MEIIINTRENFKELALSALLTNDIEVLRSIKNGKTSKRFVKLETLQDIQQYHSMDEHTDCVIFLKDARSKLDNGWIGSVLNGKPIKPPFGFIPSMPEHEILSIISKIKAEIQ